MLLLFQGGGATPVDGEIAWTQAADSWAATAAVEVSGSVAWTQAADAWALTGAAEVSGEVAWTQTGDVWALGSTVVTPAVCEIAWTQAAQTWGLTASARVTKALAWTESADAWTADVAACCRSEIGITQLADVWSVAAAVAAPAVAAQQQQVYFGFDRQRTKAQLRAERVRLGIIKAPKKAKATIRRIAESYDDEDEAVEALIQALQAQSQAYRAIYAEILRKQIRQRMEDDEEAALVLLM